MVVKVIGKTDTFTVIFDRIDEKRWNALVPANVAGEYIMDLLLTTMQVMWDIWQQQCLL